MPTLMATSTSVPSWQPPAAAAPASLTLSLNGVEFMLTPKDNAAQVSFQTNAQGQIVLDLANFTGSLKVATTTLTTATSSPLSTGRTTVAPKSAAKVVVEEPNSPESILPATTSSVTPGQQKLTFQKKKTAGIPKKPRNKRTTSDVSCSKSSSSKKSRPTTPPMQQSMEIPTQMEGGTPDFSQTMPSNSNSSSTSTQEAFVAAPRVPMEVVDETKVPGESVQEILNRVNSSNDSVGEEEPAAPVLGNSFVPRDESSQDDNGIRSEDETPVTKNTVATEETTPIADETPKAPCARWGHTMTQLNDDRLLIYGGQSFDLGGNPTILSDVHIYNPSQRSWDKPINCRGEARQWHSATFLPERQLLLAFGGETQDTLKKNKVITSDSLKVLDTDIMLWYPPAVSGDVPTGRSGHTATLIPSTNEVVLFGGVKGSKWLNTVTVLDTVRWIWSTPQVVGSPPKPRSYHTATAVPCTKGDDQNQYKLVIFGGNNKTSCFNTVHVLEMVTENDQTVWKWSHPTVQGQPPFPRTGHTATLMEDAKTICIYGGWDPNEETEENIFKSSFLLNTETWTWSTGPKAIAGGSGTDAVQLDDCGPKRCGHTASIHPETGEVLLFGGRILGERLAGDFQRLVPETN